MDVPLKVRRIVADPKQSKAKPTIQNSYEARQVVVEKGRLLLPVSVCQPQYISIFVNIIYCMVWIYYIYSVRKERICSVSWAGLSSDHPSGESCEARIVDLVVECGDQSVSEIMPQL